MKSQYKIILILILFICVGITTLLFFKTYRNQLNTSTTPTKMVSIGDSIITVEIADDPESRRQGLSNRKFLDNNTGMLFTFMHDYPQGIVPRFWMKDMQFPIDIVWIFDNTVIDIDRNVLPPASDQSWEALPTYAPDQPVHYVLEVSAGWAEKNSISPGDGVSLDV